MQYLINHITIQIPATEAGDGEGEDKIPTWTKIGGGRWAGAVDDDTTVQSIQFLVQHGIIVPLIRMTVTDVVPSLWMYYSSGLIHPIEATVRIMPNCRKADLGRFKVAPDVCQVDEAD